MALEGEILRSAQNDKGGDFAALAKHVELICIDYNKAPRIGHRLAAEDVLQFLYEKHLAWRGLREHWARKTSAPSAVSRSLEGWDSTTARTVASGLKHVPRRCPP